MKDLAIKITHLLLAACLMTAGITYDPQATYAILIENVDMDTPLGMFEPDGKLTMNPGDLINLRSFADQEGSSYLATGSFEWSSSNNDVVSVELFRNGQNTIVRTMAISEGTADIIRRSKDGSTAAMNVTVKDTSPHLTIDARATSVKYASKWRTLVGVEGTYERTAKEKILKRINEIRYEACKKRYPVPDDPEKKLKASDYVPIKWSSDLEWIAQIRAAESTVRQEHDRPNGRNCFSVTHNGIKPTGECLAWNYSGIMEGIEQWYEEKDDWVKQNTGNETGHYTAMIDPSIDYVGIGGFVKESGGWHGIAGEFVSKEDAIYSIMLDVRETVYRDNFIDRDEKYYDDSLYNDGLYTDYPILQLPDIPDNPDGLDNLEDLERLYGVKTLEEFAQRANAGTLELNLPEEQSDLKGQTIQMIEVISTRLGKAKIDVPKNIKKGTKKQIFVNRPAYNVPAVVLDARWSSSDESIISITEDGTITALKPGKATITAEFGEKTVKKAINVIK